MMYNCKWFPDHYITGGVLIPGICRNILEGFKLNNAGDNGPFEGSYKIGGASQNDNENRGYSCDGPESRHDFDINEVDGTVTSYYDETWSESCRLSSIVIGQHEGRQLTGTGNHNWVSCDEFPFNSWDQGGSNMEPSTNCVPGYQQQIQGTINGLPRMISQYAYWTNSAGTQVRSATRKPWTANWLGSSAIGTIGPRGNVDKDTHWNWNRDNKKSLTFHLFNSDTDTTPLGTKYEVFNHKLTAGDPGDETDMANVIAAINLMDNPKYEMGRINAYCDTNEPQLFHTGWGFYVRAKGCHVTFDNSAAVTKLRRGEQPTSEEMFNITRKSSSLISQSAARLTSSRS
ncbi:hypothetical protein BDV12DRAFT_31278 [Aspergillus spectabilis]